MKVLVLGASGLLGSAALAPLCEHFDVVAADLHPAQGVMRVDAMDLKQVCDAARGCDAMVNFIIADYTKAMGKYDQEYEDRMMPINVVTAQHAFEAAHREGVKRVVFISSLTIQLGKPEYEVCDPALQPRPSNVYACTKLFGENCGQMYAANFGLSVICLRLGQPLPARGGDKRVFGSNYAKSLTEACVAMSHRDMANSVICALRAPQISFAALNVTSLGPRDRYALARTREVIGYWPKDRLNAEGYFEPVEGS